MAEPGTEAFEKLVALLNYPMFVVTTGVGGTAAGCLVGFASQVSIHPPRFLVGLSTKNHTFRAFHETDFAGGDRVFCPRSRIADHNRSGHHDRG